jgi:hypothetical protein
MPEYQVFTVGPDGDFIGSKVLICDDDAQAIDQARQWSGPRYAGRLKHDDK